VKGIVVMLVIFAGVATATAAGVSTRPFAATRTNSCLAAHKVISNVVAKGSAVPPGTPVTAALEFSFALIPSQALDHGSIVFARDVATARRASALLFAFYVKQALQVKGIDQARVKALIRQSMSLRGNAITLWVNHPVKPASRSRIAACLR
jgi:hypothetical protein